jgi:hypothetical protein
VVASGKPFDIDDCNEDVVDAGVRNGRELWVFIRQRLNRAANAR